MSVRLYGKQVVLLENTTKEFQYCRLQIEKVSYWLSSKQSMSNHVSLCQDMYFLLAFP